MKSREQIIRDVRSMSDEQLAAAICVPITDAGVETKYRKIKATFSQDQVNEALGRKGISYAYTPNARRKAEAIAIFEQVDPTLIYYATVNHTFITPPCIVL